jgi:hypothetical protein
MALQEAGTFDFLVSGRGDPPCPLPATQISAVLGATVTQTLTFDNPFTEPVSVDLSVACDGNSQELQLAMDRTTKVAVGPLGSCPICLVYTPKNLSGIEGAVIAHAKCSYSQEPVRFVLPVVGVAYMGTLGQAIELQTPVRRPLEKQLQVQLQGIQNAERCDHVSAQVQLDPEHSEDAPSVAALAASVVRFPFSGSVSCGCCCRLVLLSCQAYQLFAACLKTCNDDRYS